MDYFEWLFLKNIHRFEKLEKNNMSKAPEHFRPYDHAAAQAGAPIGLRNGAKVTIHHVASDKLIGMRGGANHSLFAAEWAFNGRNLDTDAIGNYLDLVMLPLGMCEGKPVFAGDKLEWAHMGRRESVLATPEMRDMDDLTWPRHEPKYPQTKMTGEEISQVYLAGPGDPHVCFVHVVNTAIARACKDGDVVPAAMLEKVAGEAAEATYNVMMGLSHRTAYCDLKIDFAAIIKRVKEGKV